MVSARDTTCTRTVADGLQAGRRLLADSPSAALDSQLLLAHVLRRERSWILAHGERELTTDEAATFRDLIERRARGVPVAYLRGYCEWHGMELHVTPDVLVPRPETELVADAAVRMARATGARSAVDVGTGSGAIALQLARALPELDVIGTDISAAALAVARRNAAALSLDGSIRWHRGDLLAGLEPEVDLIVANLPYLSEPMMHDLPADVRHEPALALYGGPEGLELYERLFQQVIRRGWPAPLVLETDPRLAAALASSARELFPDRQVRVLQDYARLDRIVTLGE